MIKLWHEISLFFKLQLSATILLVLPPPLNTETLTTKLMGNNECRDLLLNPVSISFLGSSRGGFPPCISRNNTETRWRRRRGRERALRPGSNKTSLNAFSRGTKARRNFEMKLWVPCISVSFYPSILLFFFFFFFLYNSPRIRSRWVWSREERKREGEGEREGRRILVENCSSLGLFRLSREGSLFSYEVNCFLRHSGLFKNS